MLGRKVALGAAWLVGARLISRGLDAVAMLVMARILTPADFGLVALATAVFFILLTVSDLSLSNALIQMRDPQDKAYDTAFTLNVARGVLLFAIMVAVAVPYANVYEDARLVPLLMVLGVAPFVQGFLSPRMAHLARELQFQPMVIREVSARFAGFVLSIGVAYATESYWALVVGRLLAPVVMVATSYRLAPYRPSFSLSHWRDLMGFSTWLTLSQALNSLNFQMDRFLIGGTLGKPTLGQYALGGELAALPTQAPLQPMMQALYSGLAKISDRPDQLREAYLSSQSLVLFVVLPLGFLLSAFAEPLVKVALGPEWDLVGQIVAILAPVFAIQLMSGPANALCMAHGWTRAIFWRDFANLCLRVPLLLAGLAYAGLDGVVWARVVSGLAIVYFNLSLCQKLIGVSVIAQLLAGWRSIFSSLAAFAVAIVCAQSTFMPATTPVEVIAVMTTCAAGCGIIYLLLHFVMWVMAGKPAGAESRLVGIAKSVLAQRKLV